MSDAAVVGLAEPINNLDGDVDQTDFGLFQICLSGADQPHPERCPDRDFDDDGDVDGDDHGLLQRCMSGANNRAEPACDD